MGTTNYATVNGILVGESGPNGNVYSHTDALGSVTMTTNGSGQILNQYRYKPYGTVKYKTGTAPDPEFLWVGSQGYRQTGRVHSNAYMRARHFGYLQGAWTTVDPLWPKQHTYTYSGQNSTSYLDPYGLEVCTHNSVTLCTLVRSVAP